VRPSRFAAVTKVTRDAWKEALANQAIKKELRQLFEELVALVPVKKDMIPDDATILNSHMFVVNKYAANGDFEKVKARLVADGRDQDPAMYNKKTMREILPAIGVCRTFPRDIIFAPIQYLGLGIKHIHTVQEITRLKGILYHAMQDSLLGSLYKISLSCFIIEVGLASPIHTISYQKFGHLVTSSLIKSSWEFLHHSQIEL
jgi:hypothetical protein